MKIAKYTDNPEKQDIHKRIYKFVLDVLRLVKELPDNTQTRVIIYQLTKSATSMGANDQEADGSESRKDFIAKYTIVKKENKETLYWLSLLKDLYIDFALKIEPLLQECNEILLIVSKIIMNTQKGESK